MYCDLPPWLTVLPLMSLVALGSQLAGLRCTSWLLALQHLGFLHCCCILRGCPGFCGAPTHHAAPPPCTLTPPPLPIRPVPSVPPPPPASGGAAG